MATSANAARQARFDDSQITRAITTNLAVDARISPHLVDAATKDGIVTLSGTVSHLLEKERTLQLVERIRGVRGVIDNLNVRAVARSDEQIERDVADALAENPTTEAYEVLVDSDRGMVTLTGDVDSWAEKLMAANVAKRVKGIKAVDNNIEVSLDYDRTDAEIEADVRARLRIDPYIDEELIDSRVNDRTVSLSGTVGSLAERNDAKRLAHVGAVERVISHLEVEPWAKSEMERQDRLVDLSDQDIKRNVKDAFLYDPRVAVDDVTIQVRDGRVWLSGTVEDLQAKRAAERDAELATGVWKVENHILVRPKDTLADDEIEDRIRSALKRNPYVERHEIRVAVRNRYAFLDGHVDNRHEKSEAEEAASRINGVAGVENYITFREDWTWKRDSEIKEDIQAEFLWSPFVDGDTITVRVEDGHVELGGRVKTWREYRDAVENAFEGGARTVRSYLRVQQYDKVFDEYWPEPPEDDLLL